MLSLLRRCRTASDYRRAVSIIWRRLIRFEFWPWWALYLPVFLTILGQIIRHYSLTLPTVANPGMSLGGLVGADKNHLLEQLQQNAPDSAPETVVIPDAERDIIKHTVDRIKLPAAVKPIHGQRGEGVFIIKTEQDYQQLLARNLTGGYIVQSYVDGKEFGISYDRRPDEDHGHIRSLVYKQRPVIVGDGNHTLRHLILHHPRLGLMAGFLLERWSHRLNDVPAKGQEVEVVPVGTHCKGAVFYDYCSHITDRLRDYCDRVTAALDGVYLCRLDVKTPSLAALKKGEGIRILEINGLTAEPAHIYDPDYPLTKAVSALNTQWRRAFEIAAANRDRGYTPLPPRQIWQQYRKYQDQIAQAAQTV